MAEVQLNFHFVLTNKHNYRVIFVFWGYEKQRINDIEG